MDTSGFFTYPAGAAAQPEAPRPGLLPDRTEAEWAVLLGYTETQRFRRDQTVFTAGEADRALYILSEGRLEVVGPPAAVVDAPSTVGEAAFLDGLPRATTVRAVTDCELERLSFEAFEALAARHPRLGRELLLDVGRIVAARLRAAGSAAPGWTG